MDIVEDFLLDIYNMADTSDGTEAIVLSKDNLERISANIDSLDNIYSSVLKLRYVFGYSTAEISEALAVSTDVVKQRLKRGRDKLEALLMKEADTNGY
ncbi:hypothetical protein FACS18949_13970 [Clostridia bacterium]|nr:hypothetical protein FACS189425_09950 [Clostridia bacterium]GHV35628.1 hypothetical protein FACS18949_13970 [Clostridia bacterium]